MSKLSVVATPIGNLEDITQRALRVLSEADLILCEDTRTTAKLLQKYEIHTPRMAYHSHTGLRGEEKILAVLREGKHLALVSDAGTPTISDPGAKLVSIVREELGDEVTIEAIPGPSALTAALSLAGVPASEFLFLGFLPQKKGRQTALKEVCATERTVVLYESPHRLLKLLKELESGLPEKRKVSVARELTKVYEELVQGSAEDVLAHFEARPETVKGECVVIVSPRL